jgi:hypothetical protein
MPHSSIRLPAVAVFAAALPLALVATLTTTAGIAAAELLSQGKPTTASSVENAVSTPAAAAVDGNAGTRWSSAFTNNEWLAVDLGATATITSVELLWEAAYGRSFAIQTSSNGQTWTTIHTETNGTGGAQTITVNGTGRYVRMLGIQRATGYGYSLWEFEVFGTFGSGPSNPLPGGGDLGPNVYVFNQSTPTQVIQSALDQAFQQQETDQFGTARYQFLFAPGTYNVHAHIGFYTSINGLGRNPDAVNINGGVWVDAQWFGGNATQNFWRSAENLAITPHTGEARWAVAQAAPFRRIHVRGNLNLAPSSFGWASGGFIADSIVDGIVRTYSQQQWLSRDSSFGGWEGSVWNMVFSGVEGAPPPNFPNPSHTVLNNSPIMREKPYLYLDGNNFAVFVPSLASNTRGATWRNGGATPGTSIPLSQFFVADPSDSAATINQALNQGLHLLFTPGVYHINQTITVNRPNTVVLGLGYATLVNDNGVVPMRVADVDGVKIAGLLFDAGTTQAPVLLEVGPLGSSASHSSNPISLHDVFLRVGGAVAGKVTDALIINSNNTIIDHIWSWRGDHGSGIGWNVNTADRGLVVNGNNVIAYGVFVEHYRQHNTVWNGNGGRTIFYQSELAYDPPNQAAWMNGSTQGWASYKVGNNVTTHEAWGLGAYSYNNVDPSIVTASGFEVPVRSGVRMHNLVTVSLGGNGIIRHTINNTGNEASGVNTIPAYVVSYP